jgi:hypothetical protein
LGTEFLEFKLFSYVCDATIQTAILRVMSNRIDHNHILREWQCKDFKLSAEHWKLLDNLAGSSMTAPITAAPPRPFTAPAEHAWLQAHARAPTHPFIRVTGSSLREL